MFKNKMIIESISYLSQEKSKIVIFKKRDYVNFF